MLKVFLIGEKANTLVLKQGKDDNLFITGDNTIIIDKTSLFKIIASLVQSEIIDKRVLLGFLEEMHTY